MTVDQTGPSQLTLPTAGDVRGQGEESLPQSFRVNLPVVSPPVSSHDHLHRHGDGFSELCSCSCLKSPLTIGQRKIEPAT